MGGIFGCVSKEDCVSDVFYGTDYLSHLGTKRGGMAFSNSKGFKRKIHSLENSYFRTKFEADLKGFSGRSGIGVISDYEDQPILAQSHLGLFGIVTVSRINNLEELAQEAIQSKKCFSEIGPTGINPTEVVSKLINEKDSFVEGIEYAQKRIEGSCTILLLAREGIYAARDRLGRTCLSIGERNNACAASSEDCAFPNLGFQSIRDVGPGEIILISPDGLERLRAPNQEMQVCAFLWVYYGFPASSFEGINVEEARYACGEKLALNDDVEVDCVGGVPDSGLAHAIGYANCREIPYRRPFVKYTPTWPRSFMPQEQKIRDLIAQMKLIPIDRLIKQRLLFCEDSIVRGTQLKDNAKKLFELGAKEIHMRPACPPLIYPCEFLNFSQSRTTLDLIGRRAIEQVVGKSHEKEVKRFTDENSEEYKQMIELIRKELGLTSLKYQKINDLVDSVGLPKERLCTHCWDGSSYF
ncbi:MAG: amidophosphoribosyltransferase [Patescibacteria group bacterium]